jgi:uncharacterized protein YceK
MRGFQLSYLMLVLFAQTGCGTLVNLWDPPKGPQMLGTGCCYPFGGVTRSGYLAGGGPIVGVGEVISGNVTLCKGEFGTGFEEIGAGLFLFSAGLVAIADTPLSLVGDVLTWPIAYAREKEYPWATWWGRQSVPVDPARSTSESENQSTPADSEPATSEPAIKAGPLVSDWSREATARRKIVW